MEIELTNGEKWEMREPKIKDSKLVENITNDTARERKLIANLCMKTDDEIDNLLMRDYLKLRAGLDSFFM